jgi:hypothetical protein
VGQRATMDLRHQQTSEEKKLDRKIQLSRCATKI